jgi:hypothetical protein
MKPQQREATRMTEKPIKTSHWFRPAGPDECIVGISRGVPRKIAAGYRLARELAPGPYFKSASVHDYKALFFQGLSTLSPEKTVARLYDLANGRSPVLVCYEPPDPKGPWCHRGYVSAWLHDSLGIEIHEVGQEHEGFGWAHPKIPAQYRAVNLTPDFTNEIKRYEGKTFQRLGVTYKIIGRDPLQADHVIVQSMSTSKAHSIHVDVLFRYVERLPGIAPGDEGGTLKLL